MQPVYPSLPCSLTSVFPGTQSAAQVNLHLTPSHACSHSFANHLGGELSRHLDLVRAFDEFTAMLYAALTDIPLVPTDATLQTMQVASCSTTWTWQEPLMRQLPCSMPPMCCWLWSTCTPGAWSIETSSPRTCCWMLRATARWQTLASPRRLVLTRPTPFVARLTTR